MRPLGTAALVLGLILTASPAFAQNRGAVYGLGGLTFGTETGGVFGGGGSAAINENVAIIGEVGRMTNVLPESVQDVIDLVLDFTELGTGLESNLDVKVPAVYGFGGVRATGNSSSRVTPFAEGGFGVAQLTLDLDLQVAGIDFSEIIDLFDFPDETVAMFVAGGGVNVQMNEQASVDAGFRYTRLFSEDGGVNVGQVYGAVRIGF
jgi:opacity protein-like surface antigen